MHSLHPTASKPTTGLLDHVPTKLLKELLPVAEEPLLNIINSSLSLGHVPKPFKLAVIKSLQIKSLLLSHHHSTSALVSEILTSVLQTVQKNKTTVYIWTVHIYRLYRRQCANKDTVYYKDILRYQCTNTHYTPYLHVCIMSTSMHSNM